MKVPTKSKITLREIAEIGIFLDDYMEKYRGTRSKTYGRLAAESMLDDQEDLIWDLREVWDEYWPQVEPMFNKNGKLCAFVRRNLYEKCT